MFGGRRTGDAGSTARGGFGGGRCSPTPGGVALTRRDAPSTPRRRGNKQRFLSRMHKPLRSNRRDANLMGVSSPDSVDGGQSCEPSAATPDTIEREKRGRRKSMPSKVRRSLGSSFESDPVLQADVSVGDLKPKFRLIFSLLKKRGWHYQKGDLQHNGYYMKPYVKKKELGEIGVDVWTSPDDLLRHLIDNKERSYADIFEEFFKKQPIFHIRANKMSGSSSDREGNFFNDSSSNGSGSIAEEEEDKEHAWCVPKRRKQIARRTRTSMSPSQDGGLDLYELGEFCWGELRKQAWDYVPAKGLFSYTYLQPDVSRQDGVEGKTMFTGERALASWVLENRLDLVAKFRERNSRLLEADDEEEDDEEQEAVASDKENAQTVSVRKIEKETEDNEVKAHATKASSSTLLSSDASPPSLARHKQRRRKARASRVMGSARKDILDMTRFGEFCWGELHKEGWDYCSAKGIYSWSYLKPGVQRSEAEEGDTMFTGEAALAEYMLDHRPSFLERYRARHTVRKAKVEESNKAKGVVKGRRKSDSAALAPTAKRGAAKAAAQRKSEDALSIRDPQKVDTPDQRPFDIDKDLTFGMLWPDILRNELGWGYFPYSGLEGNYIYAMPEVKKRSDGEMGVNMWCREEEIVDFVKHDAAMRATCVPLLQSLYGDSEDDASMGHATRTISPISTHSDSQQSSAASDRSQTSVYQRDDDAEQREEEQARTDFDFDRDVTFGKLWPNVLRYELGWKYFSHSGLQGNWLYCLPEVQTKASGTIGVNMWYDEAEVVKYVKSHPKVRAECEKLLIKNTSPRALVPAAVLSKAQEHLTFRELWPKVLRKNLGWKAFPFKGLDASWLYALPHVEKRASGTLGVDMWTSEQDVERYVNSHPHILRQCHEVLKREREVVARAAADKEKPTHRRSRTLSAASVTPEDEEDSESQSDDCPELTFRSLWPNVLRHELGWKHFPYSGLEGSWCYALPHVKRMSDGVMGKDMWCREADVVRFVKSQPVLRDKCLAFVAQQESDLSDEDDDDDDDESSSESNAVSQDEEPDDSEWVFGELWRNVLRKQLGWKAKTYSGLEGTWLYTLPHIDKASGGKMGEDMFCREEDAMKFVKQDKHTRQACVEYYEEKARKRRKRQEIRQEEQRKRSEQAERERQERRLQKRRERERERQSDLLDQNAVDDDDDDEEDEGDSADSEKINPATWHRDIGFRDLWPEVLQELGWNYFRYSGLEGSWVYALPSVGRITEGTMGKDMWANEVAIVEFVKTSPTWWKRCAPLLHERLKAELASIKDRKAMRKKDKARKLEMKHRANKKATQRRVIRRNTIGGSQMGKLLAKAGKQARRKLSGKGRYATKEDQGDAEEVDDDNDEEEEEEITISDLEFEDVWGVLKRHHGWQEFTVASNGGKETYFATPHVTSILSGKLGENLWSSESQVLSHVTRSKDLAEECVERFLSEGLHHKRRRPASSGTKSKPVNVLHERLNKPVHTRSPLSSLSVFSNPSRTSDMNHEDDDAPIEFNSLWSDLKQSGWKHCKGDGLASFFYMAPHVARKSEGRLGIDMFDERGLVEYFMKKRKSRKTPSSPVSPHNVAVWEKMVRQGWRNVGSFFVRPGVKVGDPSVLVADHCSVFAHSSAAISAFVQENSRPQKRKRDAANDGDRNATKRSRRNSSLVSRHAMDENASDSDNGSDEEGPSVDEAMLRGIVATEKTFWIDVWPLYLKAGWKYRYGSGLVEYRFLMPGVKPSDSVIGVNTITTVADMCAHFESNRSTILKQIHLAHDKEQEQQGQQAQEKQKAKELAERQPEDQTDTQMGVVEEEDDDDNIGPQIHSDNEEEQQGEDNHEAQKEQMREEKPREREKEETPTEADNSGMSATSLGNADNSHSSQHEDLAMAEEEDPKLDGEKLRKEFNEAKEICDELKERWMGREHQVDTLLCLMAPRELRKAPLFIYGDTATGKTGLLRDMLQSLRYSHSYVDCTECYTPKILFQRLLSQLPVPDASSGAQPGDTGDSDEESDEEVVDSEAARVGGGRDASEYEAMKNRNIMANRAILESLGIDIRDPNPAEDTAEESLKENQPEKQNNNNNNNNKSVTALRGKRKRCDRIWDFILHLERGLQQVEDKGTHYLVLDNAHKLHEMNGTLIPALLNLERDTSCNVCVVLISRTVSMDLEVTLWGLPACCVEFPTYSAIETRNLIAQMVTRMSPAVAPGLARDFACFVFQTFNQHVRDLRELERITADLWRIFEAKLAKKQADASQGSMHLVLEARIALVFKKLYHHDFENDPQMFQVPASKLHRLDKIEIKLAADLPYHSKILLIAAFLASHNSTEHDRALFGSSEIRLTKRQKLARSSAAATKRNNSIAQTLLGPRVFELERLVNLYRAITDVLSPSKTTARSRYLNQEIYKQIASLSSTGLLSKVSKEDDLDQVKFKCNAPIEFVDAVSDTLQLTLGDFLSS
ncbi:Origin recognition complex subunit 5 [Durusdinium trenchii]|uniref:Origin recognition complex subunit 5 n=1 Tax=Durusdinium trenchii TaxID=1381693 RepID=A0ABP0SN10_9DINO